MKKTRILAAITAAAALLALSSYVSPYWTLHQMKTAIAERNADGLSKHIDFPALRSSFKVQMTAMMNKHMASAEMKDNPFASAAQMMGAALVDRVIDTAVSPAGVLAMMEAGKAQPNARSGGSTDAATEHSDYAVNYRGWNTVAIFTSQQDAGQFILKRNGLWSWQLSALEIPESVLNGAD